MAEGSNNSKVYLVGAGPGDPGLLTLKGKRCLEEAEVVVYDYLVDPRILAYAHPKAELIYAGKRGGREAITQKEINQLLLTKASTGKTVVRLKGGDPFLFGRGGEEAEAIVAAGIELEVVPGVTSAVAVPAYAGIPLTHRDYTSAVTIVTGPMQPIGVWPKSPGASSLPSIATRLRTVLELVKVTRSILPSFSQARSSSTFVCGCTVR